MFEFRSSNSVSMENSRFLSREERNEMIKELIELKKRANELPTLLKRIYERINTIEDRLGLKIDVVTNKPDVLKQNNEPLPSSSALPTPRAPNPLPSSEFFTNNRYGTDSHRSGADKIKTWKDLADMDLDVIKSTYGQHVAANKINELPQPIVAPPTLLSANGQPPSQAIIFTKTGIAKPVGPIARAPEAITPVTPVPLPDQYIKSLGPLGPKINKLVEEEKSKETTDPVSGSKQLTNLEPGFQYPSYIYKGCRTPTERRRAKDKWQKLNPHLFPNRMSIHRRIAKFKALEEEGGIPVESLLDKERLERLPSMTVDGPTTYKNGWFNQWNLQTQPSRLSFNTAQSQNPVYQQPLTTHFRGYTPGYKGLTEFPAAHYLRNQPTQSRPFFR